MGRPRERRPGPPEAGETASRFLCHNLFLLGLGLPRDLGGLAHLDLAGLDGLRQLGRAVVKNDLGLLHGRNADIQKLGGFLLRDRGGLRGLGENS